MRRRKHQRRVYYYPHPPQLLLSQARELRRNCGGCLSQRAACVRRCAHSFQAADVTPSLAVIHVAMTDDVGQPGMVTRIGRWHSKVQAIGCLLRTDSIKPAEGRVKG